LLKKRIFLLLFPNNNYISSNIIIETINMKIGILSSGGDCPGINATIRGVAKTAINHYNMEIIGILDGYQGLIEKNYIEIKRHSLTGLLNTGGTILGTSRLKPFKKKNCTPEINMPNIMKQNIEALNLDCVVCIGGNGTQKTTAKMAKIGVPVIGIPKTIDNDIWGTDMTFGFDSAVTIATDAIDRLHSTASSHKRAMVIEVMGHKAGWIALHSGMAGGGDIILLPELGYNINNVCETIIKRTEKGKSYSIIVVAEGIPVDGNLRAGEYIAKEIAARTNLETRETVLGHVQRGGAPTPYDRNLATRMGAYATELIAARKFNEMVILRSGKMHSLPLSEVAGKLKLVTPDNELVVQGKRLGVCFG
jgi:6-phosphofructokinase 1